MNAVGAWAPTRQLLGGMVCLWVTIAPVALFGAGPESAFDPAVLIGEWHIDANPKDRCKTTSFIVSLARASDQSLRIEEHQSCGPAEYVLHYVGTFMTEGDRILIAAMPTPKDDVDTPVVKVGGDQDKSYTPDHLTLWYRPGRCALIGSRRDARGRSAHVEFHHDGCGPK